MQLLYAHITILRKQLPSCNTVAYSEVSAQVAILTIFLKCTLDYYIQAQYFE